MSDERSQYLEITARFRRDSNAGDGWSWEIAPDGLHLAYKDELDEFAATQWTVGGWDDPSAGPIEFINSVLALDGWSIVAVHDTERTQTWVDGLATGRTTAYRIIMHRRVSPDQSGSYGDDQPALENQDPPDLVNVSFEEAFDRELALELGDLGPAPGIPIKNDLPPDLVNVSFEEAFDRELALELGDLGPASDIPISGDVPRGGRARDGDRGRRRHR